MNDEWGTSNDEEGSDANCGVGPAGTRFLGGHGIQTTELTGGTTAKMSGSMATYFSKKLWQLAGTVKP